MDPDLERIFDAIDAAAAELRSMKGPVHLSEQYLRSIDEVEAMPQNRSGADKTWLRDAIERDRRYFASVRRVR